MGDDQYSDVGVLRDSAKAVEEIGHVAGGVLVHGSRLRCGQGVDYNKRGLLGVDGADQLVQAAIIEGCKPGAVGDVEARFGALRD